MAEYKKTVAVDLDGVLARYDGWKGVEVIGEPIPGAREFMMDIVARGFNVVVHSARCSAQNGDPNVAADVIGKWLRLHQIPYTRIHTERGKPIAFAYVDDRAVPCEPQRNTSGAKIAFMCALEIIESLSEVKVDG